MRGILAFGSSFSGGLEQDYMLFPHYLYLSLYTTTLPPIYYYIFLLYSIYYITFWLFLSAAAAIFNNIYQYIKHNDNENVMMKNGLDDKMIMIHDYLTIIIQDYNNTHQNKY